MTTAHVLSHWKQFGRERGATHMILAAVPGQHDYNYPVWVWPGENVADTIALYRDEGGQDIECVYQIGLEEDRRL
jgi:hypothetical protein